MSVLIADTESYPNLWCAGFKRVSDGKVVVLENSARRELDVGRLEAILRGHQIVGFNLQSYDLAMFWAAVRGWSNERLKELSDEIIVGRIPWWGLEDHCGFRFPRIDFIDLIEPQPNAVASLKTLNGRLHGPTMRDLPYEPGRVLTEAEMDEVIAYLGNDLDATERLFDALKEPLEMRVEIGAELGGIDLRSKSDTQVGFAILKKRVEDKTGQKLGKPEWLAGKSFHYAIPDFIQFQTPELQALLERIRAHKFIVGPKGKVELPDFLAKAPVMIGGSAYQVGIGGLHSKEKNRSVWSDDAHVLIDVDAGSYYPAIELQLGLYPPAMGPEMLPAYASIRADRMAAKAAHKRGVPKQKNRAEALKISLNGGLFGNTSNPYSPAYSPQITIAITLTGQLSLLMLIERGEACGFAAVSANTDGVTFRCPRAQTNPIVDDRLGDFEGDIPFSRTFREITDQWEKDVGFDLEFVAYDSLHNLSVNAYLAIKPDGKVKRKGLLANPWNDPTQIREQLMKNPNMTICSDAALAFIQHGTPVEQTIRECDDIRGFVTVVNVRGGGTWCGEYLGKVIRYVWSNNGEPVFYKDPHPTTGNFKKVSKTDGCRPMMTLDDTIPFDLDVAHYVEEANEILRNVGVLNRPPPIPKEPRLTKARVHTLLLMAAIG